MRQALLSVRLGSHHKDRAHHPYFNAQDALCKGVKEDMDYHTRQWAQHNSWQVDKSVEEHAEMAATMAMLDVMDTVYTRRMSSKRLQSSQRCVRVSWWAGSG